MNDKLWLREQYILNRVDERVDRLAELGNRQLRDLGPEGYTNGFSNLTGLNKEEAQILVQEPAYFYKLVYSQRSRS